MNSFGESFKTVDIGDNLKAAIQPDMINAALVCVPTEQHIDIAIEALSYGCHLFIEKPISHNLNGVDLLIDAAESQGKILMVGHNFRWTNLIKDAYYRIYTKNQIGELQTIRVHAGSHYDYRNKVDDYALKSGVILDSATHHIDALQMFMGWPNKVHSLARCVIGQSDDEAEIILQYPDRRIASIYVSLLQKPYLVRYMFIGSNGMFELKLNEDMQPVYNLEMLTFRDAILGKQVFYIEGLHARNVLRIALAAKDSALNG